MSMMHHPNVVRYLCSFIAQHELWLVMPLLDVGSCATIMQKQYKCGFKDDDLIATILNETLKGLAYFHSGGRIHRDIKAGNILLSSNGSVQLADFGVSGSIMDVDEKLNRHKTFVGTPCWMAPEIMDQTHGYSESVDIWSFGITALELAFGHPPYSIYQPMKVMLLTLQEAPPTVDTYGDHSHTFCDSFKDMVRVCLQKDPTKRPTAKELLEHSFFKKHAQKTSYIQSQLTSKCHKLDHDVDYSKPIKRGSTQSKQVSESDPKGKPAPVSGWFFPPTPAELQKMQHSQLYGDQESPSSPPTAQLGRFQIAEAEPTHTRTRLDAQIESNAFAAHVTAPSTPTVQVHGRFVMSTPEPSPGGADVAQTPITPSTGTSRFEIQDVDETNETSTSPPVVLNYGNTVKAGRFQMDDSEQ
jgi:serine/threonine-protein kinase OSR1/STK39